MGWSIHHPVGLIYYAPQHCYRGYILTTTRGDYYANLIDRLLKLKGDSFGGN